MQNKNEIKPKIDQNWPLNSWHPKTSIFGDKPPGPVWVAFWTLNEPFRSPAEGPNFFSNFLACHF